MRLFLAILGCALFGGAWVVTAVLAWYRWDLTNRGLIVNYPWTFCLCFAAMFLGLLALALAGEDKEDGDDGRETAS